MTKSLILIKQESDKMKKRKHIKIRRKWIINFPIVLIMVGIMLLIQSMLPDGKQKQTMLSLVIGIISFICGIAVNYITRHIKITIKTKEKNKANINIITTFLDKQFDKNTIAVTGISIFILAYILIHVILSKEINYTIPIFLLIMSVMIVINQSLTIYRVKKQYFGTSYDEAREILYFVKKSKDKDSNNGKFIFTDEQPEIPSANEQTEYS